MSEDDAQGKALYSVRACVIVAFFGGPIAITLFSLLNSRLIGRLRKERWLFAGAFLISIALYLYIFQFFPDISSFSEYMQQRRSSSFMRLYPKILAMLLCAGFYALHLRYHRAMQFSGNAPLKPWTSGAYAFIANDAVYLFKMAISTKILFPEGL